MSTPFEQGKNAKVKPGGVARLIKSAAPPVSGFRFADTPEQHFQNPNQFSTALKEQAERLAFVDAGPLTRLDIDGNALGTDWRFSKAGFNDLCATAEMPVRFINRLSVVNEGLALEVVEQALTSFFHTKSDRLVVLDTERNVIEGVVSKDSYTPIPHQQVMDYALSANPALGFTNGWLWGTRMRMTAVADCKPVEPVKGDIVKLGVNLENALNGDRSVVVSDYAERLSCTNGMTCLDRLGCTWIKHEGDMEYKVGKAVMACAGRVELMAPAMARATKYILDLEGVKAVREYLKEMRSPRFMEVITIEAMEEAKKEGRDETELTLWNFVNGVTSTAKVAKSIHTRVELEGLGYSTLVRFGAVLKASKEAPAPAVATN
jgi:hypothetical protein